MFASSIVIDSVNSVILLAVFRESIVSTRSWYSLIHRTKCEPTFRIATVLSMGLFANLNIQGMPCTVLNCLSTEKC